MVVQRQCTVVDDIGGGDAGIHLGEFSLVAILNDQAATDRAFRERGIAAVQGDISEGVAADATELAACNRQRPNVGTIVPKLQVTVLDRQGIKEDLGVPECGVVLNVHGDIVALKVFTLVSLDDESDSIFGKLAWHADEERAFGTESIVCQQRQGPCRTVVDRARMVAVPGEAQVASALHAQFARTAQDAVDRRRRACFEVNRARTVHDDRVAEVPVVLDRQQGVVGRDSVERQIASDGSFVRAVEDGFSADDRHVARDVGVVVGAKDKHRSRAVEQHGTVERAVDIKSALGLDDRFPDLQRSAVGNGDLGLAADGGRIGSVRSCDGEFTAGDVQKAVDCGRCHVERVVVAGDNDIALHIHLRQIEVVVVFGERDVSFERQVLENCAGPGIVFALRAAGEKKIAAERVGLIVALRGEVTSGIQGRLPDGAEVVRSAGVVQEIQRTVDDIDRPGVQRSHDGDGCVRSFFFSDAQGSGCQRCRRLDHQAALV